MGVSVWGEGNERRYETVGGANVDDGCRIALAAQFIQCVVSAWIAEAHVGMEESVAVVAVDDKGVSSA